jgi:hypothetical protein
MKASSEGDVCPAVDIYCIVTNNCGSVQIDLTSVVGGCPIVTNNAFIPPTSTTISKCVGKGCDLDCNGIGNTTISIIFPTEGEFPNQTTIFPSPPVSYQWYWIDESGGHNAFSDGNNIYGSQTSSICLTDPGGSCTAYDIYCFYSNRYGSITTETYSTCFTPNSMISIM